MAVSAIATIPSQAPGNVRSVPVSARYSLAARVNQVAVDRCATAGSATKAPRHPTCRCIVPLHRPPRPAHSVVMRHRPAQEHAPRMPDPARLTRRRMAALLAGGTALLAAGCGEAEPPTSTPTAATAATSPPASTATSTARVPSLATPTPAAVAGAQPTTASRAPTATTAPPAPAPVVPVATVAAPRPTRPPPVQTEAPTATPTPEPTTPSPTPTPPPTPTRPPLRSLLTGLEISPNARAQRVVAIKIDNAHRGPAPERTQHSRRRLRARY